MVKKPKRKELRCGALFIHEFSVQSEERDRDNEPMYDDEVEHYKCELQPEHSGNHRDYIDHERPAYIEWAGDDRPICPKCKKHVESVKKCETCRKAMCEECMHPCRKNIANRRVNYGSFHEWRNCSVCLKKEKK